MDEYDDGPYWVILLMYGSHDMRHTGFRRLTVVNGTLGFWGVTLMHHLKLESSNLEFKKPSYGLNKTWVLENENFDSNSLHNLYISFYTSWS